MDGGDPNCSHIDIVCIDTYLLSCLSCGAIGAIEPVVAPRPSPRTENLTHTLVPIQPLVWPASVEYLASSSDAQVAEALQLCELKKSQVQPRTVPGEQNAPDFENQMEDDYTKIFVHPSRSPLSINLWRSTRTSDFSRRIFLDEDWSPLPITLSCDRALRSLRKKDCKVTVWVDAICINQWSSSERSHQVSLMHQIYSMADIVHVYVGEAEHGLDKTGDRSIHQLKNFGTIGATSLFSLDNTFTTFFSRPYFSRLWVVQEVLLARSITMHCGEFSVELSKDAITKIKQHGVQVPSWIGLIGRIKSESKIPLDEFANLLLATSDCGMSDMRDKIFGLLGLVEDTEAELLNADYNLMVREVYIGVAAYLLRNKNCFQVLEIAGSEEKMGLRQTYGIPSWVPLWSSQTMMNSNEDISLEYAALEEDYREHPGLRARDYEFVKIQSLGCPPENSQTGSGSEHPSKHKIEIHSATGALVAYGYNVIDLDSLHLLFKSGPEHPKIRMNVISSDFCSFGGGVVLGIRAALWALRRARNAKERSYCIIGILGCDKLFLATRSTTVGHPATYELLSSCVVALIHDAKKVKVNMEHPLPEIWLHLLEKCYPLSRTSLDFLIRWRKILNTLTHENAELSDKHKTHATTQLWQSSEQSDENDPLWAEYRAMNGGYSSEATDHPMSNMELLFKFWDEAAFESVDRLRHLADADKKHEPDLTAWEHSMTMMHSYVHILAWSSDSPSTFRRRVQWSSDFQSQLDTWRQTANRLAWAFANMPGIDFSVESHVRDVLITPGLADDILKTLRSYLKRSRSKVKIEQMLKDTPLIGSADWSNFKINFESMCLAFSGYEDVKRMMLRRNVVKGMILAEYKLDQIVIV
ncbi:heterokaryon incompatibility protein-domain-containing protein [Dactylonectria macrodidyma]|uniref:Heterokaryon incompatibility protein-domain-containing protein n=1 Tax=Dactylonectria macrodidyma TaxID=307937 RepID=A0A9P9EAR7_9HYPO|nr:heterokaryon incompatibility protein-domain-containing protein [Dactylonectria macrodidyma]